MRRDKPHRACSRFLPNLLPRCTSKTSALAPWSTLRQTPQSARSAPATAGAAVVVTGYSKSGLFLESLYTIYKAATAIAAAKRLSVTAIRDYLRAAARALADRDHGFAEISLLLCRSKGRPPLRLQTCAERVPAWRRPSDRTSHSGPMSGGSAARSPANRAVGTFHVLRR